MPGHPSRLRVWSKWLGSAASAAGKRIRKAGRFTADVERGDGVGSGVKVEFEAEDTAPAVDRYQTRRGNNAMNTFLDRVPSIFPFTCF